MRAIPSGHLPRATSIDDAGEQRKRSGCLLAAGTEAQATGNDPVAQQTFGRIVGERQRAAGVISRALTGIGGGPIAVQYFRLQEWVDSATGLVALGGLIFGCGLPGWAIVRWVFNFIEKNRDAGIGEVAKEVRKVL